MVHLFWTIEINHQSHLQRLDGDDRWNFSMNPRTSAHLMLPPTKFPFFCL